MSSFIHTRTNGPATGPVTVSTLCGYRRWPADAGGGAGNEGLGGRRRRPPDRLVPVHQPRHPERGTRAPAPRPRPPPPPPAGAAHAPHRAAGSARPTATAAPPHRRPAPAARSPSPSGSCSDMAALPLVGGLPGGQQLRERGPPTRQPGLDRTGRGSRLRRDLLDAQIAQMMQHHRLPLRLRQLPQRLARASCAPAPAPAYGPPADGAAPAPATASPAASGSPRAASRPYGSTPPEPPPPGRRHGGPRPVRTPPGPRPEPRRDPPSTRTTAPPAGGTRSRRRYRTPPPSRAVGQRPRPRRFPGNSLRHRCNPPPLPCVQKPNQHS